MLLLLQGKTLLLLLGLLLLYTLNDSGLILGIQLIELLSRHSGDTSHSARSTQGHLTGHMTGRDLCTTTHLTTAINTHSGT
jgi:hypothetical protein